MDFDHLRGIFTAFILKQPRVLLVLVGLCVLYVFTLFFPMLHSICMFGGLVNILVFVRVKGTSRDLDSSLKNQLDVMQDAVVFGITGYCISLLLIPYFLFQTNRSSQDLFAWLMANTTISPNPTNSEKPLSDTQDYNSGD